MQNPIVQLLFVVSIWIFANSEYTNKYITCPLGYEKLSNATSKFFSQHEFMCYKIFRKPLTWFEADETCTNERSFLPRLTKTGKGEPVNKLSEYWVGLTTVFNVLQWTSWPPQLFKMSEKGELNGIDNSQFGDCAYLNIEYEELLFDDCRRKPSRKTFYCINYGIVIDGYFLIQGKDFEVTLASRFNLNVNSSAKERFPVLNCTVQIYNRIFSQHVGDFHVAWVKNGIYLPDAAEFSLDLNNVQWPKSVSNSLKLQNEPQLNILHRDGTYWCEVSERGSRPWYKSNTIRVSFSDYEVAVVALTSSTPKRDLLQQIFLNEEYYATTATMNFEAYRPRANVLRAYLYVRGNLAKFMRDAYERISKLEARKREMGVLDIFLTAYDFCPGHTSVFNRSFVYWEKTAAGEFAVSSSPCFDDRGVIYARKCIFDFENGSRWEAFPRNLHCGASSRIQVLLDDWRYRTNILRGKCDEGFVPLYLNRENIYPDYCASQSMEKPLSFENALEYCNRRNADLPGPMILEGHLWTNNFKNTGDLITWTTFSYQSGILQWRTVFESKFINNIPEMEISSWPKHSEMFCTTANISNGDVKMIRANCNEPNSFVCIKMANTLSTSPKCPHGWLTGVDGDQNSPCWDGKLYYNNNMSEICHKNDAVVERNISLILPGSKLLEAGKKKYNTNMVETVCSIGIPFGHVTMAKIECKDGLRLVEAENIAACVRRRIANRSGRVVIGLVESDPRKIRCKGYNVVEAFGVQWFFNDILLYDTTEMGIRDRGFESIISPNVAQQGYYRCEMRIGDPMTSISSSEILFQIPNGTNFILPVSDGDHDSCRLAIDNLRQQSRVDKLRIHFSEDPEHIWRAFPSYSNSSYFCNILIVPKRLKDSTFRGTLLRADSCPEEVGKFSRTWPQTRSGSAAIPKEICILDNGAQVTRRCKGDFKIGPRWEDDNSPACSTERRQILVALENLTKVTINNDNVNGVLTKLTYLTRNASDIDELSLIYIVEILENLATSNVDFKVQNVQDSFQTLEHVLNVGAETLSRAQTAMLTSVRMISALRNIVKQYRIDGKSNATFSTPSVEILKSKIANGGGYSYTEEAHNNNSETISSSHFVSFDPKQAEETKMANSEILIILPDDLTHCDNSSVASVILYKNSKLFFDTNIASKSFRNATQYVVSISVEGKCDQRWFDDPLKIYIEKSDNILTDRLKCVFLDLSVENSQWSQMGCIYQGIKYGKVLCLCDHMTDFSVMMEVEVHQIHVIHRIILQIITYAGIACSNLGLAFIMLTYICHRRWRKGNMHHTIFNFALALFAALTSYVFIDRVFENNYLCICVGAILHYSVLASFSWMSVEGILQYLRFVKVLGTYIPKFMLKFGLLAWGLPLVPVATILVLDRESYVNEEKEICWLTGKPLLYGFALPLSLYMMLNFCLFLRIIINLTCDKKVAFNSLDNTQNTSGVFPNFTKLDKRKMIATFSFIFLMGLPWIFGLLAMKDMGDATIVFKYCHTIINSFQGFIIFLLQVTCDSSVRELWSATTRRTFQRSMSDNSNCSDMGMSDSNNRIRSYGRKLLPMTCCISDIRLEEVLL